MVLMVLVMLLADWTCDLSWLHAASAVVAFLPAA